MNTQQAYNKWSETYDEVVNRTRDLEGKVFRKLLSDIIGERVLEVGCGTGKNTSFLVENSKNICAIDLSEQMLAKARSKIISGQVKFIQADINQKWKFSNEKFDLITFSLVLEHIEDLDHIFRETSQILNEEGLVYVGELHPFKQYSGSKARFETENGIQVVKCFDHHISDFIESAIKAGLKLVKLEEYFDEDNRSEIPRILALIFKK